jgi:hypothetical protein
MYSTRPAKTSSSRKSRRTGRQRTGGQRTGRQRTGGQRTGRQRTGRQRTGRQRTGRQRTGRQRAGRQRTRSKGGQPDEVDFSYTGTSSQHPKDTDGATGESLACVKFSWNDTHQFSVYLKHPNEDDEGLGATFETDLAVALGDWATRQQPALTLTNLGSDVSRAAAQIRGQRTRQQPVNGKFAVRAGSI